MTENIELYQNQIALARTEIKNLRQKLSALKHEHRKEIKHIKDILEGLKCNNCAAEATTIINQNHSNDTSASPDDECVVFHPIGYIRTIFENKRALPRQPTLLKSSGTVVIDPSVFSNPTHALDGLEEFSHMWLLYHFHKTEGSKTPAKVTPPRLGERRGVFATRSPHRPCPIGMSLVKIQSIEGNIIHFMGIDMIDGTPLLDIKPYIPQYDYPVTFDNPIATRIRPPTEGICDVLDPINNLQLDEGEYRTSSLSPRLNQIAVDTDSPLRRSPYDEDILSPDNQDTQLSNILPASSQSSESPSSIDLVDGAQPSPTRRLQTERGAPDGQERFTPPQSNLLNANYDGIRVASWITNPPSQRYHVTFNEDAFARLHELIGARAESFRTNIECLLSEDPRSLYVRTRYPDHEYSCVLEDLSISCMFDATAGVCTIIAVRSAEELQEN